MFFKKAVNEAELTVSLPDKALFIARCKDSLHGAEKKALLLGQIYVVCGHSLWAPFVTVIVQIMYCLVVCCVVALLACIKTFGGSLPHQNLHAKIATAQALKMKWPN